MGKLTKKFNNAAKRLGNMALGGAMIMTGAPLLFAGPVVGIALAFAGFACPLLWIGSFAAFTGGIGAGSALVGGGMQRINGR
jgi:hypothetical protein